MKTRKRATETGTLVGVRLQPDMLKIVDRFSKDAAEPLTRPQAIRLMLLDWMTVNGYLNPTPDPERAE